MDKLITDLQRRAHDDAASRTYYPDISRDYYDFRPRT
jgi:hypothetical protein